MHRLQLELLSLHAEGGDSQHVHRQVDKSLGLALDSLEADDLVEACSTNGPIVRDRTGAEFFVFAHVNSGHCRQKQFNASGINGVRKVYGLFDIIRDTYERNPEWVFPK